MELLVKFVLYFLISTSASDYALTKPIIRTSVEAGGGGGGMVEANELHFTPRLPRQIVQPVWSIDSTQQVDGKVKVTKHNLKEAAAIRKAIQKAVASGKYAVEVANPSGAEVEVPTRPPMMEPNQKPVTMPPSFFALFNAPAEWSWEMPSLWATPERMEEMQRGITQFWEDAIGIFQ